MWYCEDCEEVFDEPVTYHDDLTEYCGVWGSGTYEGCPNPKCKSEFIKEIEEEEEEEEDESDEDTLEGALESQLSR